MRTAFYCVTDARHFIGAVALLNSLRIAGHGDPFVVVDCGLRERQRAALDGHAELVPAPPGVPPMLLKPAGPLARPADLVVVLDADVIVTRPLTPLLDAARAGRIVVFANDNAERHFPEWGELLGLPAPRRQPYAASGHILARADVGLPLLRRLAACQDALDLGTTLLGRGSTPANPFHYPDMDVLNALLAGEVPAEGLEIADHALAPHAPFPGLSLLDERTLRCRAADGTEPYVLHHVLNKPWLARTSANIYSRLLPRLLLAPDVEVRLRPADVPLRLRTGRLATLDRRLSGLQASVSPHVRGRLGVRPRVESWLAAARGQA